MCCDGRREDEAPCLDARDEIDLRRGGGGQPLDRGAERCGVEQKGCDVAEPYAGLREIRDRSDSCGQVSVCPGHATRALHNFISLALLRDRLPRNAASTNAGTS